MPLYRVYSTCPVLRRHHATVFWLNYRQSSTWTRYSSAFCHSRSASQPKSVKFEASSANTPTVHSVLLRDQWSASHLHDSCFPSARRLIRLLPARFRIPLALHVTLSHTDRVRDHVTACWRRWKIRHLAAVSRRFPRRLTSLSSSSSLHARNPLRVKAVFAPSGSFIYLKWPSETELLYAVIDCPFCWL